MLIRYSNYQILYLPVLSSTGAHQVLCLSENGNWSSDSLDCRLGFTKQTDNVEALIIESLKSIYYQQVQREKGTLRAYLVTVFENRFLF